MAYTHDDKKPGQLIRSADWNAMGNEVVRLEGDKVDRAGDTIKGPLAVNGNLTVGLPTKGATLRILNKQEDANGGTLTLGTDAATSASLRLGYHGTYSWIQSHVTKPLLINPLGGNVGIGTGTTVPAEMLHLTSKGSAKIKIEADTDNSGESDHPQLLFAQDGGQVTGYLGFSDGTNHLRLASTYDNADGMIDFMTRNAVRMTIHGDGNVGIGTTDPKAKLQIGDTINHRAGYDFSPSALVVRSKTPNGGNSPAAAESVLALVREGVASQAYGNMADFRLRRFENNGTNARTELSVFLTEGAFAPQQIMTLRSNGNVGIGTGEPAEMLHLASKGSAKIKIEADTDNSGESDHPQLLFAQDGGQVTGYLGFSGGTNHLRLASTYDNADGMIDFITRNAVRMTIHGDGNVGIGTTTKGTLNKLKFEGDKQNVAWLRLGDYAVDDKASAKIQFAGWEKLHGGLRFVPKDTANNQGKFIFSTGGTDDPDSQTSLLTIQQNGNVGIGTTTPGAMLDIYASKKTHGGWYEAIRFSQSEHSAITHPGGGLLFGLHSDRNFYFADTKGASIKYLLSINADTGKLSKLDVADAFTATIECADFKMGHSSRRGSPGRALVDGGTSLYLNYGPDWPSVIHYGTFSKASSRELKENIADLSHQEAFNILEGLDPVRYTLKTDEAKKTQLGFIAEEAPDVVASLDRKAVTNDHIVAVLTRVVKEQQKTITGLVERINHLDVRN